MRLYRIFFDVVFGLVVFSLSLQSVHALTLENPQTALSDYIRHEDGVFSMQFLGSVPGQGFTAHLYNLTSQQWLTEDEVDRSIWTHALVIIVPDKVNSRRGMLFVGGGSNDDNFPDETNGVVQIITQLALGSQSIVSAVFQAPNQPLVFKGSSMPLKEDALVAYTWKKAMDTGNYVYPAYLPMVKSVVRAMDGIQSVIAGHGGHRIDQFVLTGFSKRGATVWLTAAVDDRVMAIAPGVIDFLNLAPSFEHHFKSYGTYSSAVHDYIDAGIVDLIRAPEFEKLLKVVDPYSYLDNLSMPKFLLNSSGDQFFLPDSSKFYFSDLSGESLIRYAPNTDHSLANSATGIQDSMFSLLGWYQSILYDLPRPEMHWEVEREGADAQLVAETSIVPLEVRFWQAHNNTVRDFRKESIGEAWVYTPVTVSADGRYRANLSRDATGFTAHYFEFVYAGVTGLPVTYSSEVFVTPDIEAFNMPDEINQPESARYWAEQVEGVINNRASDIDRNTLTGYLPLPVFNVIHNDMYDLLSALSINYHMPSSVALRECTSTRLNLRSKEINWHSEADLGRHLGDRPLWQHYRLADQWSENLPWLSAYICHELNGLSAAP
ncbi:hypothetical protein MNBD_GAMMA09-2383 [hydrothermal vent metagenome]|uniref:PhoP/Q-regulated protein PqaA n=1 Tax=hydrothermal vent metagenome TaxID=652676 RepID=A0A3B0XI92_9ZZZZ